MDAGLGEGSSERGRLGRSNVGLIREKVEFRGAEDVVREIWASEVL